MAITWTAVITLEVAITRQVKSLSVDPSMLSSS
jgi:hypothetical protein